MRFAPYFPRWLDNLFEAVMGISAALVMGLLLVVLYVTASILLLPVWAVQFVYSLFPTKD